MELFWNKQDKNTTEGLDILGIRNVDQSIEKSWVAGITTISIRARYLSLLAWVLKVYYDEKIDQHGQGEFDENEFKNILRNLEFVILASTNYEQKNTQGLLGKQNFSEKYQKFIESGSIDLKFDKGGTLYNTYNMPCRFFEILGQSQNRDILAKLTDRGLKFYNIINTKLNDHDIVNKIISNGIFTIDDLKSVYHIFSLSGVDRKHNKEELGLLQKSFLEPMNNNKSSKSKYKNFRGTIKWILKNSQSESMSASDLILNNYKNLALNKISNPTTVEIAWMKYELHRRVHFALELLMQAFTQTLQAIDGGNINGVLVEWQNYNKLSTQLSELLNTEYVDYRKSLKFIFDQISKEYFLQNNLKPNKINSQSPSNASIFSLVLLSVCYLQLDQDKNSNPNHNGKILREAFNIIGSKEESVYDIMNRLLDKCVISPHLQTTWRKMSEDQKCSLRFYNEGDVLKPTGIQTGSGYSGTRLNNVMVMLSDINFLEKNNSGKYYTTEKGLNIKNHL